MKHPYTIIKPSPRLSILLVKRGEKVDQMRLAKDLSGFNDTHLLDLRPEAILSQIRSELSENMCLEVQKEV